MRDTGTRHRNKEWNLPTTDEGEILDWDSVKIAVLMDIRDELQALNALLRCPNFTEFPKTLRAIQCNTRKPRKIKKT